MRGNGERGEFLPLAQLLVHPPGTAVLLVWEVGNVHKFTTESNVLSLFGVLLRQISMMDVLRPVVAEKSPVRVGPGWGVVFGAGHLFSEAEPPHEISCVYISNESLDPELQCNAQKREDASSIVLVTFLSPPRGSAVKPGSAMSVACPSARKHQEMITLAWRCCPTTGRDCGANVLRLPVFLTSGTRSSR